LKDNAMTEPTPPLAGRREWIGLAVIALPCLLYSMDLTVLNLAVPAISADLRPSASQLLWIVDIYGFMIAGCLITMGTLGDRIGRRRLLMIGAAAFGLASAVAAFSTSANMLILARAALGVASATLAPSTLSLIRNMFLDPRERTFAIGIWIASFSAGGAIGPLVGGVMLEFFWWGSVFLINIPIMAALLALAPLLLPEFRDPNAGRIDIPSVLLSLAAVLSVIFGLKRIAEAGLAWPPIAVILVGLGLAALFWQRQKRLSDPVIDVALFRSRIFTASLAINVIGFFAAFGTFLFVAQYLQLVLGMGPLEAGLWSVPSALGFIVGSMVAPRLVAKLGTAPMMVAGFVCAALGFVLMSFLAQGGVLIVVGGLVLTALGLAPVITMTTDLVIGAAPPERAGAAAGMSETSAELGGALGIAVLGSLVTALYRLSVESALPGGLPAASVAGARDTLGAALTIAEGLGTSAGPAVAEAARGAFVDAVSIATLVSAAIALLAGLVAAIWLRGGGAPQDIIETEPERAPAHAG
jgi:DHA2 family multidrug resistance protein-like MFS transporter